MHTCASARCLPSAAASCVQRQQRLPLRHGARGASLRVNSYAEFEPEIDGPGVDALLEKDRPKTADLNPEALLAAFADDATTTSTTVAVAQQQAASEEQTARQQQGERGPASKRADKLREEAGTPTRAREAIDRGLQEYGAGRYQAALDLFQLALELPGSGYMRMSGSPKEYSCASEGEENAALYNMACCWVALGQKQSALTVLEALLENSFDDYQAIRSDPDLAPLRGPELDKLLAKRDGLVAKLFGGGKKKDSSNNKPWLRW